MSLTGHYQSVATDRYEVGYQKPAAGQVTGFETHVG